MVGGGVAGFVTTYIQFHSLCGVNVADIVSVKESVESQGILRPERVLSLIGLGEDLVVPLSVRSEHHAPGLFDESLHC